MTQRDEAEGSTYWTWGTTAANHDIGQLYSVSAPGYSEVLAYDGKARLSQRSITTDANYLIDFSYHPQTGLLDTMTYPESTSGYRFKLQYEYTVGTLSKIKRFDAPNTEYWTLNALDVRGNVLDELLGNGVQVISSVDPLTGLLESRTAGSNAGTSIQNLEYEWDVNGNLWKRRDVRQGNLEEVFMHDALNRVVGSTLNGSPNLAVAYDLIGNIISKDGSQYSYHATKKHAVVTAAGNTYGYDANGNASTRNGHAINWTSYNYPSSIAGSEVSSQFWYGPDRQRFKQVGSYSGGTETTYYVGGILEKLVTSTRTHFKHYVAAPNGSIAAYTRRTDATEDTFYFTSDHLGSVDSVTNEASAVQVRLSYGGFGKRRNEAGWSGAVPGADLSAVADTTRHGYTEHEHLDNLGLIHMNGRVQDATIGRFLSADPIVQAPGNAQSLNRYSYTWNGPLTMVDPSGFEGDAGDNGGSPTSREDVMNENIVITGVRSTCNHACQDALSSAAAVRSLSALGAQGPAIPNAGPNATSDEETIEIIEVTARKPQRDGCNDTLIRWGNNVARFSADMGDASSKVMMTGLVTAGVGAVTLQPEVAAVGVAMTGTGGLGGVVAGIAQFGAGVMQGFGGAGYSNAVNAAVTLGAGALIGRGIKGPAPTGPRSASQRAGDNLRNNSAVVVGGVFNAVTSFLEDVGPQQKSCTR